MSQERLFHLHRLEHHDEVTLGHGVAVGNGHLDDCSLHRAGEGCAASSAASTRSASDTARSAGARLGAQATEATKARRKNDL